MGREWICISDLINSLLDARVMSLLNEMLKDLNVNRTTSELPYTFVVHEKLSFFLSWRKFVPWLLIGFSILLFLFLFFSHKDKLAPSSIAQQPAIAATANVELQTSVITEQVAWMPSVLVPAPQFKNEFAQVTPIIVPDIPIEDSFADEEEGARNDINKVFNHMSAKEWYEEEFNKALDAIEAGDSTQAIYRLESVLDRFPDAADARESLAAVYFSQGQYAQSMKIINKGLQVQPNALNLNLMKARLLYDDNQAGQALQIMQRFHPDIREEPDFYGLLAAALQTTGRISEAGSIYKILVELQPSNGQYWVGYGITLENNNQLQQAVVAYKHVAECYDIEPAVRSYAEDRLKILQG